MRDFDHAVAISAKKKKGLDELMSELGIMLRPIRSYLQLAIPQGAGQAIARLRAVGQVDEEYYEGDLVHFKARIPPHLRDEFARYIEKDLKEAQD